MMFIKYDALGGNKFIAHSSCGKKISFQSVGTYGHWERILIEFRHEPKARILERLAICRCSIYYGELSLDGSIRMLERYQNFQSFTSDLLVEGIRISYDDFNCAKKRIQKRFSEGFPII